MERLGTRRQDNIRRPKLIEGQAGIHVDAAFVLYIYEPMSAS